MKFRPQPREVGLRRFLVGRVRVALATAALAASGAALAALPSAASAQSGGCTSAASGPAWYGLTSAYTCINVYGHRHWVSAVEGDWYGIGTLCNYRFRTRFRNIHGTLYESDYSRTHVGCRVAWGGWTTFYGAYKKTGMVCVQVIENGRKVGHAACESIF